MANLTPTTFQLSDFQNWNEYLQQEGYVVIQNILPESEKKEAFNLFKKDWNTISPNFNFEDNSTFAIENTPMMFSKGMAVYNGFGQSDFMWYLRGRENIQETFRKIHNCQELVTSMDGFSVYVSGNQKSKSWLHIDQNPNNPIKCYQAAYNLLPVTEDSAGFVVVPKSHITFKPQINHRRDWIMLKSTDTVDDCPVKLLIPENCFTIWNSRTIHCNRGMQEKKKKELNRVTAFITMLPKSIRSQEALEEKKKAYLEGASSTHWANKCILVKYPYGFKKRYLERGFGNITPKLVNGEIPTERLELI